MLKEKDGGNAKIKPLKILFKPNITVLLMAKNTILTFIIQINEL
jgi:hypothetical protein